MLSVCLSPALLHLYDPTDTITVIIDVFRATSTMAAALDNGAIYITPVSTVEDCIAIGKATPNSITAGEREGKVAPGLEHGNSPSEYPRSFVEGKALILTTTNGTRLLHMVKGAAHIITGSFLNLTAVCNFLLESKRPVLLACAGWKDRFNIEDTLFAGAVVSQIGAHFQSHCDSAIAAQTLYEATAKDGLWAAIQRSSHYRRLSAYGLEHDMKYCITPDLHPVVPILTEGRLVIA
jgi:2-phosphosulfolactate phosphatase